MRILHFHDAPHIHGGATAYLKRLLPEMASRGHENRLFCLDQAAEWLPSEDQAHFTYQWPASALQRRRDFHHFHAPLAEALTMWIQEQGPDLVHVQNCSAFRSTIFPTILKLGVPLLMTVHDFSLIDPNPWGLERSGISGLLKQILDRQSLAKARKSVFECTQRFLCPTETLQNGIGFPRGKSRLQRLPIELAGAPELPLDRLHLFFAGTLFRSKGVDVLLHALAGSTGDLRDATLEIAGCGDQEDKLKALCRELGLDARVRFLGFCSAEEMEAAYARANLQVLPSRVPENSPLTVLEAGARGRPSIASHAGGVPELLGNGRGWTFPNEDHEALRQVLQKLARDTSALCNPARGMRQWVRHEFAPQKHWDHVDSTYHELKR
ncbi:MAG: glycosyltransferase family 4 protein [Planctomycetota bacterium]|nr:glycosyltransferase family 4 protein [Planctomycetota bacterium]MDA1114003.1 glycosyltransferase family 4 protein [Planctomycetota bacterium]